VIAKITKGRTARPALAYDFGPGRRDEHENARILTGSVPGSWRQVGRLMDAHAQQRGLQQPIWRCSLSLPEEDGTLRDEQFAAIARQYVGSMGFGGCPWVAVRHGDDHIHLTVVRVGWDGRTVDDHADFIKSRPIVRALEARYGLINADDRSDRSAPQVSGPERAAAERRGSPEPERLQIRRLAREARAAAVGLGREAFEEELAARGVKYRLSSSPTTGRVHGYSLSLPTWLDADGAQVWVTASKTAKDLSWQKLEPVLARREHSTAPPAPDRTGRTPADGHQVEQAGKPERPEDRRPESIAPPVDPAAQLLAAVRAARAAEKEEEFVFPPYLASEKRIDRRTHGYLTAHQLLTTRADAVKTLRARQDALNEATGKAMRLDGIASGVGAGLDVAELHERRAELESAVVHLADATAHQAQADEHTGNAKASRAVAEEATKKAGRSRLVLAAMGTSQGAERGMAKAAVEFAEQEERAAVRLAAAAERSRERAKEAAPDVADPTRALERLTADWKKLESAARRQDVDRARVMKVEHIAVVQQARAAVGSARQALAEVEGEIAFRGTLPPKAVEGENQARTEHEQRERAKAARGRSTTTSTRRSPKAGPRKPPPVSHPVPRPQQQPRPQPPTL
jgi:hypothetical protein